MSEEYSNLPAQRAKMNTLDHLHHLSSQAERA